MDETPFTPVDLQGSPDPERSAGSSIQECVAVEFSLVIPAYDEADRLPPYLDAVRDYFKSTPPGRYEVIVVDDGSRDGTDVVIRRLAEEWRELTLLRHDFNRGKGAAVRVGVLAARGDLVLFADADGATPIGEAARLRAALDAGADLAVGSRLAARPAGSRLRWSRNLCGRGFARLAHLLLPVPVLDPQCGFKMFRKDAARRLFESCREDGYLFDLDVLLRAGRIGLRMAEVPVSWRDQPGSKIQLGRDSWRMLCGVVRMRWELGCERRRPDAIAVPRTSTQ